MWCLDAHVSASTSLLYARGSRARVRRRSISSVFLRSLLNFVARSLTFIFGLHVSIVGIPLVETNTPIQSEGSLAMKPTRQSAVAKWCGGFALVLLCLPLGCAGGEDEHPSAYQYEATPASSAEPFDPCSVPNEGCTCNTPGEIVDCGKVMVRVDNYETCYEGSRLCGVSGVWGKCLADQAIVQLID